MDLKEDFELAAQWRRTLAAEHPEDSRNLKAAAMLDQLAKTVATINPDLLATCEEIFERGPGDERGFRAVEEQEEMICQIGFQYFQPQPKSCVGSFQAKTGR